MSVPLVRNTNWAAVLPGDWGSRGSRGLTTCASWDGWSWLRSSHFASRGNATDTLDNLHLKLQGSSHQFYPILFLLCKSFMKNRQIVLQKQSTETLHWASSSHQHGHSSNGPNSVFFQRWPWPNRSKKKIRPFKPFKAKLYDLNNWFGNVPVVFAQLPGGSRWPVVCRGGCQVISPWWHLGAFPGKMSCETYGLVIWDFNQISTKRGYTDDDSDWRHLHFFSRICLFQDNSQTTYYLPSSNPRNSTSIIPT